MSKLAEELHQKLDRLYTFIKSEKRGLSISHDMRDITYPEKLQDKIKQVDLYIRKLGIVQIERSIRERSYIYQPYINFRIIIHGYGFNFSALDNEEKWQVYCQPNSHTAFTASTYSRDNLDKVKFGKQLKTLVEKVDAILKDIMEIQQDIKKYEIEVRTRKMEDLFAAYM